MASLARYESDALLLGRTESEAQIQPRAGGLNPDDYAIDLGLIVVMPPSDSLMAN
jgi:hypothetical protein